MLRRVPVRLAPTEVPFLLPGYCGAKSFLEQVHRLVLELRGNGGVTFGGYDHG